MANAKAEVMTTYVCTPFEIGERTYCGDVHTWFTLQTFKPIPYHRLVFKAGYYVFYDFHYILIPFTRHDIWDSRIGGC